MNTAHTFWPFHTGSKLLPLATALILAAASPFAVAQSANSTAVVLTPLVMDDVAEAVTTPELPNAPSAPISVSSSASSDSLQEPQPGQPSTSVKQAAVERRWFGLGDSDAQRASRMASSTEKYILPGQLAPKLTTGDKVQIGLIHGISPFSVLGWFVSAGYSHVLDTSPNYGVDSGAFGERLGAAALRGYTEEVFSDSIMAPVFHEDPRYYKMGPRHNVVVRTAYAVSRVVVTRSDDGRMTPNYSLISGNLLAVALTNAYYPSVNRGLGQTAETFGNAMGGSAFSFFASEFISGALEAVHLKQARY